MAPASDRDRRHDGAAGRAARARQSPVHTVREPAPPPEPGRDKPADHRVGGCGRGFVRGRRVPQRPLWATCPRHRPDRRDRGRGEPQLRDRHARVCGRQRALELVRQRGHACAGRLVRRAVSDARAGDRRSTFVSRSSRRQRRRAAGGRVALAIDEPGHGTGTDGRNRFRGRTAAPLVARDSRRAPSGLAPDLTGSRTGATFAAGISVEYWSMADRGGPTGVASQARVLPGRRAHGSAPEAGRSQSEEAYIRIRDRIVCLDMPPGSVVEEGRLRDELEIGRTPIREALQRLAWENLVRSVPHRGTFVTDVNITDLARITEVRVVLEGHAARLAAERGTATDREAIGDLIERLDQVELTNQRELMRLDQAIHRQIYRSARNPFLENTLDRYFNLSLRLWYLVLDRGVRLREAVEEHVELLRAVLAGDGRRAEEVMQRHVIGFEREIRKVLVER